MKLRVISIHALTGVLLPVSLNMMLSWSSYSFPLSIQHQPPRPFPSFVVLQPGTELNNTAVGATTTTKIDIKCPIISVNEPVSGRHILLENIPE